MEGVPRIPMLSFPIRRSADTPAFKGKLQRFIAMQYGESPESFSKEIHELESLRAAAVHATHDYSGCATLKKYYCQLHFLKSRFPLSEGSPISINFSWYDVFSEQVHSWSEIDFEVSSILYNIGALHSKVAGADSRTTVDDMKNCVTHYQCAAWAFDHLRSTFSKFFTPDVSSDLLGLMSTICLAQAQECVVEKSLVDNRRSVITAKLLLQIVDYYQIGLKTADMMLKEANHLSDKMLKSLRKFKKMIELKIAYYSSLTYLYRGQQSEDQKQFGERVSFYKAAQEKIELAIKLSKNFERTDGVHETLNFVLDVVVGKASAAQKDNEFIYHEKVPAIDAIGESIKGVAIVKPIPLKIDDPSGDIFARLVPMEAHESSSLYSEEKAKLLRSYAQKIEEKNQSLQKILLAIQLENLEVHEGEVAVPQGLVDCCAAMNGKPDSIKKLVQLMGTLSGKFIDVEDRLSDIKNIFEKQEEEDTKHGHVLGKVPTSNIFVELRHEFEKYEKAHTLAKSSNETLREAVQVHVKNLKLLMKPLGELTKMIPTPEPIDANDLEAVNEMKRLAAKVEEMRKQRTTLEKELREAVQQDDITQRLVVTQEDDVEALFKQELSKHSKITQVIDQNLLAQENIARALTEANARYASTRESTQKHLAERNAFVQGLLTSYEAYEELVAKCNGGIGFYEKLEEGVAKLHARAKGIAKVQDEEREAKLSVLRPALPPPQAHFMLPSVPAARVMTGHPKLKDYLANRKAGQREPPSQHVAYPPSSPVVYPHSGPTPVDYSASDPANYTPSAPRINPSAPSNYPSASGNYNSSAPGNYPAVSGNYTPVSGNYTPVSGNYPTASTHYPPASGNNPTHPASGNYAPLPASGNYAPLPASGTFPARPASGNYPPQPASGNYSSPPVSENYPTHQASGTYPTPPPVSGNYATPPPPPVSGNYATPPPPPVSGNYASPSTSGNSLTSTNYHNASGNYPSSAPENSYSTPPVSGNCPPASGSYTPASGNTPPASGNYPPPSRNYPPALGNNPLASGNYPAATQNYPPASANNPTAPGNYSAMSGNNPPVSGNYPLAPQNYPTATGNYPSAPGNSLASGNYPAASGSYPTSVPGNSYSASTPVYSTSTPAATYNQSESFREPPPSTNTFQNPQVASSKPNTENHFHATPGQIAYDQNLPPIQSPFSGSQKLKYPEFISQANYVSQEPKYEYYPITSHYQSYTTPTQHRNDYEGYNFNGSGVQSSHSFHQPNTSQQASANNGQSSNTFYPGPQGVYQANNATAQNPPPPSSVASPTPSITSTTSLASRNIDLLTGIDMSAPPETPLLLPSTYQTTNHLH